MSGRVERDEGHTTNVLLEKIYVYKVLLLWAGGGGERGWRGEGMEGALLFHLTKSSS